MKKSDREIMEILEAYKRDGLRVHSAAQRLPGASSVLGRYAADRPFCVSMLPHRLRSEPCRVLVAWPRAPV